MTQYDYSYICLRSKLADLRDQNKKIMEGQMKIWDVVTKGLRGTKNELADATTFLRDLKFKMSSIQSQLRESKAISDTLPTVSIMELIPIRTDEALCTLLDNENLYKALYAKVILYDTRLYATT